MHGRFKNLLKRTEPSKKLEPWHRSEQVETSLLFITNFSIFERTHFDTNVCRAAEAESCLFIAEFCYQETFPKHSLIATSRCKRPIAAIVKRIFQLQLNLKVGNWFLSATSRRHIDYRLVIVLFYQHE